MSPMAQLYGGEPSLARRPLPPPPPLLLLLLLLPPGDIPPPRELRRGLFELLL
jgi:hypothetical protein